MTIPCVLASFLNIAFLGLIWPSRYSSSGGDTISTESRRHKILCGLSMSLDFLDTFSYTKKSFLATTDDPVSFLMKWASSAFFLQHLTIFYTVWLGRDSFLKIIKINGLYWKEQNSKSYLHPKAVEWAIRFICVLSVVISIMISFTAIDVMPDNVPWTVENAFKSLILWGQFVFFKTNNGTFGLEEIEKLSPTWIDVLMGIADYALQIAGPLWIRFIDICVFLSIFSLWHAVVHFYGVFVLGEEFGNDDPDDADAETERRSSIPMNFVRSESCNDDAMHSPPVSTEEDNPDDAISNDDDASSLPEINEPPQINENAQQQGDESTNRIGLLQTDGSTTRAEPTTTISTSEEEKLFFQKMWKGYHNLEDFAQAVNDSCGPLLLFFTVKTVVVFSFHLKNLFKSDWAIKLLLSYVLILTILMLVLSGQISAKMTRFKFWLLKEQRLKSRFPKEQAGKLVEAVDCRTVNVTILDTFRMDYGFATNLLITSVTFLVIIIAKDPHMMNQKSTLQSTPLPYNATTTTDGDLTEGILQQFLPYYYNIFE